MFVAHHNGDAKKQYEYSGNNKKSAQDYDVWRTSLC
jgi:hypothetical protein